MGRAGSPRTAAFVIYWLLKGARAGAPCCSRLQEGRPARHRTHFGAFRTRLVPALAGGAETGCACGARSPGGAGLRGAGPPGPPLSRPWRWGRGEAECPEVGPGDGGLTCPVSPRAPCAGCFRDNAPLCGRTCTRTVTATPPWGAGAQTPPAGPGRVLARGTGPAGATRSHFTPPTTFPALSGQSLSNARGLRVSG